MLGVGLVLGAGGPFQKIVGGAVKHDAEPFQVGQVQPDEAGVGDLGGVVGGKALLYKVGDWFDDAPGGEDLAKIEG